MCEPDAAVSAVSEVYGRLEIGAEWSLAKGAVIALHGRGRPADELLNLLSRYFDLDIWRIVAPCAPESSWYPDRYNGDPVANGPGRTGGLKQIDAAISLCHERGIPAANVVIVGFSQGGCLVAEYLLNNGCNSGTAAIFTGAAVSRTRRLDQCRGVKVLLTGGVKDAWLPLPELEATAVALASAGAVVRFETFPDDEHTVRSREMELLKEICEELLLQGA